MIGRRRCLALLAVLCCGALASAAAAARAPTAKELSAIARVLRVPGRCLYVRVSSVDRRFAKVAFRAPPSPFCLPFAANGETVVRYVGRRWRRVFSGSSNIQCPVKGLPSAVARDLRVCP